MALTGGVKTRHESMIKYPLSTFFVFFLFLNRFLTAPAAGATMRSLLRQAPLIPASIPWPVYRCERYDTDSFCPDLIVRGYIAYSFSGCMRSTFLLACASHSCSCLYCLSTWISNLFSYLSNLSFCSFLLSLLL